jgi:hypothetical protein
MVKKGEIILHKLSEQSIDKFRLSEQSIDKFLIKICTFAHVEIRGQKNWNNKSPLKCTICIV